MQTAIIIPVFNHAQQIGAVIHQARALELPIFVVNDGSSDATAERLAAIGGITVLEHAHNQGKGAALLSGFQAAREQGCDWAITLDADGQHLPADARKLLQAVSDGQRCLVVGCRQGMNDNRDVPWSSRFGRGFSNFWVWAAGGPAIGDSQSGFRLYPLPEILQLKVQARRYQYEVEVLVQARQHGLAIKEEPVTVIYQPRGERISHFRPWVDFGRNSATFSRLIFRRFFV